MLTKRSTIIFLKKTYITKTCKLKSNQLRKKIA